MNHDQRLMARTLALATEAGEADEVPVGALIADKDGQIIVEAQNRMRRDNNPMAHAEMLAIKDLQKNFQNKTNKNNHLYDYFYNNYQLFVSLEPCPMCAHAIALMRFYRLCFAAYDIKNGGVDHGARIFSHKGCNHAPEIIGGLHADKSNAILQKFFQVKRPNKT